METKTGFRDVVMRAVTVIGLLAILLLGAWGIIQIAFVLPGFFSGGSNSAPAASLSSTPAATNSITVSAPSIVNSGQPFTLSWTPLSGAAQYAYSISYSCTSGLAIKAPLPTGATQSVPCNTPFNFTSATASTVLTPILSGTQQAGVTFTVAANNLATGAIAATGGASSTALPATVGTAHASATTVAHTQQAATAATIVTHTTATRAPLYGLPDLSVIIISATPNIGGYSVQFAVQNLGTNVAPAGWTFNANIPLTTSYVYQSQPQPALHPGDSIMYTLNFSMPSRSTYQQYTPYTGYTNPCQTSYTYNGTYNYPDQTYDCATNQQQQRYIYQNIYQPDQTNWYTNPTASRTFSVTVDPTSMLQESSKANNTASITL